LGTEALFTAVESALKASASRFGLRVVYFSVQGNHVHLVVEALDRTALSRGMSSVMIRIARAINRAAGRSGAVFADHYFARELLTPAEVRRAVRYVLDNAMIHSGSEPRTDPFASPNPLTPPQTWLLRFGWIRSGAGPLPVNAWARFV
jgi:putative transposase